MSAPRGFSSQAGLAGLRHGQYVTLTPHNVAGMVPREDEQATVTDLPGRARWETLLAEVEATPPRHDCPGLSKCMTHPRWRVTVVARPSSGLTVFGAFRPHAALCDLATITHGEAIQHATERARPRCQWCGDRLTWLDDGTWQGDTHDQCPDSQDGPDDDHGTVVHVPRPTDVAALRTTR